MTEPHTADPAAGSQPRIAPGWLLIVATVLGLVVASLVGYSIGSHRGSDEHVLVGRAYHSPVQAAVKVDGWAYGFEISPNGMHWFDAHGVENEGGIPPCLMHSGYSWIRFGYSTAHGLNGTVWRTVDWVQCAHHP